MRESCVLGFQLERRAPDYASLRRGGAVLGLGPIAKLPAAAPGRGSIKSG